MPNSLKKLIFLGVSQLPLFGGLWGWLNRVKAKPHYALAFAALYEIAVFGSAFGKKVLDNLEESAVSVTADWIRGAVRGFAPGFRRRYKKQVIRDHGIVNFLGLGLINTYALSLEQVFVDLRIDASNPQKLNLNLVSRRYLEGKRQIWDYLRKINNQALENAALAIIGPPGCGKTTLLKHLALTLAANRQRAYGVHSFIPILVSLRQHVKTIASDKPPSLGILVQEYFSDKNLFATLRPPPGWFEKQIERGKCIVMLDGLDEVADLQQRRDIRSWIDIQIKNYTKCKFIVTSRPQGYRAAPLQRGHVLEVQPFNAKQVRRFLENWFLANEYIRSGEHVRAAAKKKISQDADVLIEQLNTLPAVNDLTANPLLLTMIAMVCKYYQALPRSRVELYQHIFKVLLGEWQKAKDIPDQLEPEDKLSVLRVLATYLMEHRLRDVNEDVALSVVKEPLAKLGISGPAAKSFLLDLQNSSGVLLENEIGTWSFAHLNFQEYLTAENWRLQRDVTLDLHEMITDSWWYETLRLYAGQSDATPVVKACLDIDDVPSLMLAADCLEEGAHIDAEVRRDIENRVLTSLESDDPSRRRIAAEVKLSRRLRHSFQHLDSTCEIDMKHITCAEYQLFLDDTRALGKFHQPDSWPDYNFTQGQADDPIKGLRGEDANAFCDWLTEKRGGTFRYRLPHTHEIPDESTQSNGTVSWCKNDAEFSLSDHYDMRVAQSFRGASTLRSVPFSQVMAGYHEAKNLILDSPLDLTHLLARSIAFVISREEDRDLGLAFADAEKLALKDQIDYAFDRNLDRQSVSVVAETLPYLINRACDAAFAKYLFRTYSLQRARQIELALGPIVYAIYRKDLPAAKRNAFQLRADSNLFLSWVAALVEDLLDLSQFEDSPQRIVQRTFTVRLLENACRGIKRDEIYSLPDARQRRLRRHDRNNLQTWLIRPVYERIRKFNPVIRWSRKRQTEAYESLDKDALESALLKIYWWIQITNARSDGILSAWEGIRLVREQSTESRSQTA